MVGSLHWSGLDGACGRLLRVADACHAVDGPRLARACGTHSAHPMSASLAMASMRRRRRTSARDELLEVAFTVARSRISPPCQRPVHRARPSAGSGGHGRAASRRSRPSPAAGCVRRRSRAATRSAPTAIARLVVAAEPVGVQGGELPDQLVVAVPVRRNDRRREPERGLEPRHPPVEVVPLELGLVRVEQVPVDRRGRCAQGGRSRPGSRRSRRARPCTVHDDGPIRGRRPAVGAQASAPARARRGDRAGRRSRSCWRCGRSCGRRTPP